MLNKVIIICTVAVVITIVVVAYIAIQHYDHQQASVRAEQEAASLAASLAATEQYAKQLGRDIEIRKAVASGASKGTIMSIRHRHELEDLDAEIAKAKENQKKAVNGDGKLP